MSTGILKNILRYIIHALKFIYFKHTIQWFLLNRPSCAAVTTIQLQNVSVTPGRPRGAGLSHIQRHEMRALPEALCRTGRRRQHLRGGAQGLRLSGDPQSDTAQSPPGRSEPAASRRTADGICAHDELWALTWKYFRGPKSAPAVLNDFSKWPSRGVQKHTCVEGPLAVRGRAMGLRGTVGNVQHRGYRPLTAANGREALPDKVRVASGTRRRLRRLRSPLPHPAAGDEAGFLHLLRRQAVPANRVQKPTRESHRLLCSCQLERGLQKGRECCSCH